MLDVERERERASIGLFGNSGNFYIRLGVEGKGSTNCSLVNTRTAIDFWRFFQKPTLVPSTAFSSSCIPHATTYFHFETLHDS